MKDYFGFMLEVLVSAFAWAFAPFSRRRLMACGFGEFALYFGEFAKEAAMPPLNATSSAEHKSAPLAQLAGLAAAVGKNTVAAEIAMSEAVKAGIPVAQVAADKVFSDRLVRSGTIPRRTLQYARESNRRRFTPAQSERIMRALRINVLAKEAFGDGADDWLDRPTPVFSGATPAQMLSTEAGARAVEMFIGQAMHGFAA